MQAIHPEQMENWIPIEPFETTYPAADSELPRLMGVLERLAGTGRVSAASDD